MRIFNSLFWALSFAALAQPALASNLWEEITDRSQSKATPAHYRQYRADQHQLRSLLSSAPTVDARGIVIELPLPDGNRIDVEVVEDPILAPDLARQFPDIKTYQAKAIENPAIRGRLDVTPTGFHGMLRTPDGTIYINPEKNFTPESAADIYRATAKMHDSSPREFQCKTISQHRPGNKTPLQDMWPRSAAEKTFGTSLRTYRLALSATREYSLAVANGNLNNTYAEMVTAINRVNEVFERDLAIRLQLVSSTNLISTKKSDFSDSNAPDMLDQNQTWIDSKIGAANYDVGHVFSTGGGGLAVVAATCALDGFKAQGVTGSSSPTTDTFYIDYVAHELGHQFGATHTFNADGRGAGACQGNRQPNTENGSSLLAASALEVGSGSTIMAYAGICDTQNLQNNSDDYFHGRSIQQIREFVDGDLVSKYPRADGSRCGIASATSDAAPKAQAGKDYTIPQSTPFVLTGAATDNDPGSIFHYTWEQYDLGSATTSLNAMHTDQGNGPLVRSYEGSTSPKRYVPKLPAILSGNLDANTGERLPTTSRTMKFRLTVRSGSNGVAQDDMVITVNKDAGPFTVTAPASDSTLQGLELTHALWNVAKTSVDPINCSNVDILFSDNGGTTFPTILLENTPNDGDATIQIPNITTSQARIMVQCSDNIFFNVSPGTFNISASPYHLSISGAPNKAEGNTGTTSFTFTVALNQISPTTVSVNYAVTGSGSNPASTADFGGRFPSGTLIFTPGETSKSLAIPVSGDSLTEKNEKFTVTLSNAENAALKTMTASGTIQNDDNSTTLNIAADNARTKEGNTGSTDFTFRVTRLGSSTDISTADWAISSSGTHAASENDFASGVMGAGTISFAATETSKEIVVAIKGDNTPEKDETFTITLNNPSGAQIDNSSAEGTILNDDTITSTKKSGGTNSLFLSLILLILGLWRFSHRNPVSAVN